jgi:hypothetical protein
MRVLLPSRRMENIINTKYWILNHPHHFRDTLPEVDTTTEGVELTLLVRYDNKCIEILYKDNLVMSFENIKKHDLNPNYIRQSNFILEMLKYFHDRDIENFCADISEFYFVE